MLNTAIGIAFVLIGAALALNLYRLLRRPDTTDRILALDTIGINSSSRRNSSLIFFLDTNLEQLDALSIKHG